MSEEDLLLAELVALSPEPRQPGDIDARQYVAALSYELSERSATYRLEKLVKEKKLTRHEVYDPCRRWKPIIVYRKVV